TWADRYLFTHVGRWPRGSSPEDHKFNKCAIRNSRYSLVNNSELYDLSTDLGQKQNIIDAQPAVVAELRAEYDKWWTAVQPLLVNERAYLTAPKVNPFHELYWQQFGRDDQPQTVKRKAR
ncbi:MAG TPA: arylsulfatase, partial [Pirellulales bacterium]|nr:arylsulfatase [Pirellulales bacterium]